jgi:hypothetical protein
MAALPMTGAMEAVPFQTVGRGLCSDDVAEMLRAQMELARSNPRRALELLDSVSLRPAEPGIDADEVGRWMESQRSWLQERLPMVLDESSDPVQEALDRFGSAITDLREAVSAEVEAALSRVEAMEADAELRHLAMLATAQERLDEKLARTRRKIRKDATRAHRQAVADAERILERAGLEAVRVMIEAEARQAEAVKIEDRVRAVQTRLIDGIDAAQASVRPSGRSETHLED